jgi:multidrug efflux pump subunit AcrA (membrane-fusion protein)
MPFVIEQMLNEKKGERTKMLFRNRLILALVFAVAMTSCDRHAQQNSAANSETAIAVRVQHPARITRPLSVTASGTVEALDTVDLGFQVAGRIARVFVEEGQQVQKGQLIAELDAADYQFGLQASEGQVGVAQSGFEKAQSGSRKEELEQARAAFEKAQDDYQRYRQLYERKSMAPAEWIGRTSCPRS